MTPTQDPATGQWYDADTGAPIQDPGAFLPGAAEGATGPNQEQQATNILSQLAGQPQMPAQLDLPAGYQLPGQFPVQPGQSQSRAEGQSYGVSQSGRGYDPRTGAVLDKEAQQAGLYAPMPSAQQQGEQEAANAREAAKGLSSASDRQAQIEADRLATNEQMFRARATLEGDIMRTESLANEHSEAAAQGARGRYLQQLQGLSQLQLDPTLNFTKGEGIGVAAAVFAQHFLAAGGLKVDVQGTLDKWTDRYVDAQMEKFRRGQVLADQDRIVWDMIRAEATDASDARARLRGMLLSQADTAMQAEAAKYGSQMAMAIGEEARAKIQANLANTLQEISRNTRQTMFNELQAERQLWVEKRRLSLQSWATSLDAKRNAREQEKWDLEKKALQSPQPASYQVYSLDNGQPVGAIRPEFRDNTTVMNQVAKRQGQMASIAGAVDTLKKYQAQFGPLATDHQGLIAQGLRGDDASVIMAARANLFRAIRLDAGTGANLTGNEQSLIEDEMRLNTWINQLTSTGSQRVLDATKAAVLRNGDNELRPYIQNLDGSNTAWSGSFAPQQIGVSDLSVDNPQPVQSAAAGAAERAMVPGGHGTVDATGDQFGEYIGAVTPATAGRVASEPDWVDDVARVAREYVGYSPQVDPISGTERGVMVDPTASKDAYDKLVIMSKDSSQPKRQAAALTILNNSPDDVRAVLDRSNYFWSWNDPGQTTAPSSSGVGSGFR